MASRSNRFPKLRFALITEDALQRLRPEAPKTNDPPAVTEDKEIVEAINNAVNTLVEQKLEFFKLELDQLIEDKVVEIQNRQQDFLKSMQRPKAVAVPEAHVSDASIKTVSEFGTTSKTSKRIKKLKKTKAATGDNKKKMKSAASTNCPHNGDGYATKLEMGKRSMLNIASKYFQEMDDRLKGKQ